MMKMKIKNETKWDTRDLRKLFKMVAKHEGYEPHTIEVTPRGRGGGRGGLGYGWIRISIPHKYYMQGSDGRWEKMELQELSGEKIKRIAKVLIHEIGHNRGLNHREMDSFSNIDVSFIPDDFVIRRKREKKKPKVDIKQKRYQHVLELIKKNERKLKATKTRLKKLYQKKKYYEKVLG